MPFAAEFPDLEQIEVVNEPLHDPPDKVSNGNTTAQGGSGSYYEALGGAGATGMTGSSTHSRWRGSTSRTPS